MHSIVVQLIDKLVHPVFREINGVQCKVLSLHNKVTVTSSRFLFTNSRHVLFIQGINLIVHAPILISSICMDYMYSLNNKDKISLVHAMCSQILRTADGVPLLFRKLSYMVHVINVCPHGVQWDLCVGGGGGGGGGADGGECLTLRMFSFKIQV